MNNTPTAITILDAVKELVEAGSIDAGARIAMIGALAEAAIERGLDPHAPIAEGMMTELVIASAAHLSH